MKRTLKLSAVFCAVLLSAIYAFGDIAKPKTTPGKEPKSVLYTGLEVTPDAKIYEARLQIPENVLKDLIKEAGKTSANQSLTDRVMHSSTRTMMAGLFMFLAISFAGVWLARSGQRRNVKAVAAILAIAACVGLSTVIVRANAGPPGYVYWQSLPNNLTNGKSTSAGVDIQIVSGDDSTIKLIVPLRKTSRPGEE